MNGQDLTESLLYWRGSSLEKEGIDNEVRKGIGVSLSLYYTKGSLGWTLMLFQKPYYHASLMMSSWHHLIHDIHSLSATCTISPRHLLHLNTHVIRHVTFSPTTFYHISLQPRQHHTTKLQFRPYTLYIYNCTPTLSLFPFW
jgi:hypothetical protein